MSARLDLPQGTVAFLFTGVEGSTRRWEADRAEMQRVVLRHLALLRGAIEGHGGVMFKVVGDAVQAAFPTAPDALAAALDAQRALQAQDWGTGGPLRVRMALHVGQAEPQDGDYLAPALNRLARLLAAGHGGQVLMTQAVQQLARGGLPPGAAVQDLGEHRLRDLLEPERVFQLVHPELPAAFPPLTTLARRPNNLPIQPTPFLGRERAVAEVIALLRQPDIRLVTLTGPGGTGKSRLGLQVAAEIIDAFVDGVAFVPLAPLTDPELVPSAIVDAVGLRGAGGRSPRELLRDVLCAKEMLLVLDNFEHLLAAASVVADLVATGPRLKVLTTSRAPLRLRAEHEYAVPPLPLPGRHPPPSLEQLTQFDAVRLFFERARAVKSDFSVDNQTAPAVAEICHRLDGLPLAIELAAARVRMLPPLALLSRLERRLPLLTGGPRDLPARQRTLRDAIAWSHDLLSPAEQALFRRLAVFVGGFTLDAADAVANPDGELGIDTLDGLTVLIEESLLRQEDGARAQPRFGMLETIREYALERLDASGEGSVLAGRHAAYYLDFAEGVVRDLWTWQMNDPWRQVEQEPHNVRAALERTPDHEIVRRGLLFVMAMLH